MCCAMVTVATRLLVKHDETGEEWFPRLVSVVGDKTFVGLRKADRGLLQFLGMISWESCTWLESARLARTRAAMRNMVEIVRARTPDGRMSDADAKK